MATNKYPWFKSMGGDIKPLILRILVAAGSTAAIKRGEICKVGKSTARTAAPATSGDTSALVIANQEQKADDVARYMEFIVPRPEDVFEFPLAAARAVVVGDPLAISDSETLAYTAAGTNAVARVCGDENTPRPEEKSVTLRSLTNVRVAFDEQASYFGEISGNS